MMAENTDDGFGLHPLKAISAKNIEAAIGEALGKLVPATYEVQIKKMDFSYSSNLGIGGMKMELTARQKFSYTDDIDDE